MSLFIEVCVDSLGGAFIAEKAGADRIELNSALALGGLTPSLGTFLEIRKKISLPIVIMIRPRAGDFYYSKEEFEIMLKDIELFVSYGAKSFAIGILDNNKELDLKRMKILIKKGGGAEIVLHRAFDITPDPFKTLERAVDLGIKRILTSGQKKTALEGAELIKRLIEKADGRIEILPAGGINRSNIEKLISITGVEQIHGSFLKKEKNINQSNLQSNHFGLFYLPDLIEIKKIKNIFNSTK